MNTNETRGQFLSKLVGLYGTGTIWAFGSGRPIYHEQFTAMVYGAADVRSGNKDGAPTITFTWTNDPSNTITLTGVWTPMGRYRVHRVKEGWTYEHTASGARRRETWATPLAALEAATDHERNEYLAMKSLAGEGDGHSVTI